MSDDKLPYETEHYAEEELEEYVGVPIPTFLKFVYVILPIWGFLWLWLYWDGSHGVLDRGSWQELSRAAKTTWNEGRAIHAPPPGHLEPRD